MKSTPFPTRSAVAEVPDLLAVNNSDGDLEVEFVVRANNPENNNGRALEFRIDVFQNGQPLTDPATGKEVHFYPPVTNPNGQETITETLPRGTRGTVEFEVRNASGDSTQSLQDSAPSQRLSTTVTRDSLLQSPVFTTPQSADGGPNFSFNVTLVEPLATGLYGTLYPVDANGQPDRTQGIPVNVVASDGVPNFNGIEEFFITVSASAPGSTFKLEISTLGQNGNNPSLPATSPAFTVTQRGNYNGAPTIVIAETLQGTNTAHLVLNPSRPGSRTFRILYQDASGNTGTEYSTANRDAQGNATQTQTYFGLPSVSTYTLRVQDYAPDRAYSNEATAQVTVTRMGSALNPVRIDLTSNSNGDRRVYVELGTGTQTVQPQSASANLIRLDTGVAIATGLNVVPTDGTFNLGDEAFFVDLPAGVPLNVPSALDIYIGGQNMVPSDVTRSGTFTVTTLGPIQGVPTVNATVLSNAAGQTTNNIRLDLSDPNANNQAIDTLTIEYFDAAGTQVGQTEYRSIPTNNGDPVAGTLIVAVPTTTPGNYTIQVKTSGPDTQPSNPDTDSVSFMIVGSVLATPMITLQPTNPNGDLHVAFIIDANNAFFTEVKSGRARVSRVSDPTIYQDLEVHPVDGELNSSGVEAVYIKIPANSPVLERDASGNLLPTNLKFDLRVGGNGLPDSDTAPSVQFTVYRDTTTLSAPSITVTPLQGTNTWQIDFTPNTNDSLVQFYWVQAYLGGNLQAQAFIQVRRDANGNIVPSTDFILVPALGTYEARASTFGSEIQFSPDAVRSNVSVTILGTALNPVSITRDPLAITNSRNVSLAFQDNNAVIVTEYGRVEIVRPAVGPNPEMRQFVPVAYYNPGGVYLSGANNPGVSNQAFVTIPSSMFLRDAGGNALPTTFLMYVQTGGDRIVPSNAVPTATFTVTTDQSPIVLAPTVTPITPPGGQFYTNFGVTINPNTNLTGVTNYHITIRQGGRIISETWPSVAKDANGVPIASDSNLSVPTTGTYDSSVNAYGPDVLNGPDGAATINVTQSGTPLTAPTVSGILNPDGDNTLTAQINTASLGIATQVVFRVTTMIGTVLPDIYVPVSNIRPNGELDFRVDGGITGNVDVEVADFQNSVGVGPFNPTRFPATITTAGTLFNMPTSFSVTNNAAGPNVIDFIFDPNNPTAPADTVAILRVDVPGRPSDYFYPLLSSGIPQGGGLQLFTVVLPPGANTFLVGANAGVGRPQQTDSALIGPATVTVTIASAFTVPQSPGHFFLVRFTGGTGTGIMGLTTTSTRSSHFEPAVLIREVSLSKILIMWGFLAGASKAFLAAALNFSSFTALISLLADVLLSQAVVGAAILLAVIISFIYCRQTLRTLPEILESFEKNTRKILRGLGETVRTRRYQRPGAKTSSSGSPSAISPTIRPPSALPISKPIVEIAL